MIFRTLRNLVRANPLPNKALTRAQPQSQIAVAHHRLSSSSFSGKLMSHKKYQEATDRGIPLDLITLLDSREYELLRSVGSSTPSLPVGHSVVPTRGGPSFFSSESDEMSFWLSHACLMIHAEDNENFWSGLIDVILTRRPETPKRQKALTKDSAPKSERPFVLTAFDIGMSLRLMMRAGYKINSDSLVKLLEKNSDKNTIVDPGVLSAAHTLKAVNFFLQTKCVHPESLSPAINELLHQTINRLSDENSKIMLTDLIFFANSISQPNIKSLIPKPLQSFLNPLQVKLVESTTYPDAAGGRVLSTEQAKEIITTCGRLNILNYRIIKNIFSSETVTDERLQDLSLKDIVSMLHSIAKFTSTQKECSQESLEVLEAIGYRLSHIDSKEWTEDILASVLTSYAVSEVWAKDLESLLPKIILTSAKHIQSCKASLQKLGLEELVVSTTSLVI